MISIVVPTYNEEKNVGRCLESLLRQTIPKKDYEIIVVDGHSKDKTVSIAKKYADKVIYQTSKGVGGARNDGVKISKYDLIATTDADCVIPENWLEVIIESFERKNIVAVFGRITPQENSSLYRFGLEVSSIIMEVTSLLSINFVCGANFAVSKKALFEVGGFSNLPISDDFEIGIRLTKLGKIRYNQRLVVEYNMRRIKKHGVLRGYFLTIFNDIKLLLGIKPKVKVNYAKQNY